ncbi:MAG TPA: TolC family protein [Candidatus Angelobacter sp.]|nr:TolC family protein [Candidatus Angelobacter sp.]
MKVSTILGIVLNLLVWLPAAAQQTQPAQQPRPSSVPYTDQPGYEKKSTAVSQLIDEALAKNPDVLAATHAYRGASGMHKAARALPDTQISVQQTSAGSPRPFAGYTNSEFAYTALGVSQDLPYPGKRKLRAEVSENDADAQKAEIQSVSTRIIEQIKTSYFLLSYLQQTHSIFDHDDLLLAQIEQTAEARYRAGQGSQYEVLKIQLQHSKLFQEVAMHDREEKQLQARLKQWLNRDQDSLNIVAEPITEKTERDRGLLLQFAREQNPDVEVRKANLQKALAQVDLAQKEFRPDFNIQYQYQNTDRRFRDRYMVTFGINLPNRGRRAAELTEAKENQERAQQELQAEVQGRAADLQEQLVAVQTSAGQLKIYREGLIPQAEAAFNSALAAYESNRGGFDVVLSAILDMQGIQRDYQKELADHEIALAKIESLTGTSLQ